MPLLDLSSELLWLIAGALKSRSDTNAFCRASRALHYSINPELYRRDAQHGSSAILWAAEHGRTATAEMSLRHGGDVAAEDYRGNPALVIAAGQRHIPIVELLLDNGADLECRDTDSHTPLVKAAAKGHTGMVRRLLDRGAALEAKSADERTALFEAIWGKHEDTVVLLLDRGADVDAPDHKQRTPLQCAAWSDSEAIARHLVGRGATIDARDTLGITPLIDASAEGCTGVMRVLRDAGADVGAVSYPDIEATPLDCAINNRCLEAIKLLLESGAGDLASPSAINIHIQRGSLTIACLLLESGAVDLEAAAADDKGKTVLHAAVEGRSEDIVGLLLDRGADPDVRADEGFTPLMTAAAEAYWQVFESFDKGHPWGRPKRKSRALEAIARMLLDKGADPDGPTDDGETPLMAAAARGGNLGMLNLLLRAGADVNAQEHDGRTPLYFSVDRSCYAAVDVLLAHGADPDGGGSELPPIVAAVERGSTRLVQVLLEAGATPDCEGPEGDSLLAMAERTGNERMAGALRDAGARP